MKKEHQTENQQETLQKESTQDVYATSRWMADMSEIVNETFRRQVDISFERMHKITRANFNLWSGIMKSFANPFGLDGHKKNFHGPNAEQEGHEERPDKEHSKEFHRR